MKSSVKLVHHGVARNHEALGLILEFPLSCLLLPEGALGDQEIATIY
jgi:hypothetical protein